MHFFIIKCSTSWTTSAHLLLFVYIVFKRHFGVVRSTNKHNFFTEICPEMPITWIRNRTYFLSYLISFSSVFLCSFEQLYNTIFQENVNRFLKVFSFIFDCLVQGFGEIPVSPFLNRKFLYINHTYLWEYVFSPGFFALYIPGCAF